MNCSNPECEYELDVDLSQLHCESNGPSGNHTTSYTYTGVVTCPECGNQRDVTVETDECDETGDIFSREFS